MLLSFALSENFILGKKRCNSLSEKELPRNVSFEYYRITCETQESNMGCPDMVLFCWLPSCISTKI